MRLAEALDDIVDGRAPVTTDRGERQPGWDSPGARPLDADMALDHIERAVAADSISMYEHQEEAIELGGQPAFQAELHPQIWPTVRSLAR